MPLSLAPPRQLTNLSQGCNPFQPLKMASLKVPPWTNTKPKLLRVSPKTPCQLLQVVNLRSGLKVRCGLHHLQLRWPDQKWIGDYFFKAPDPKSGSAVPREFYNDLLLYISHFDSEQLRKVLPLGQLEIKICLMVLK